MTGTPSQIEWAELIKPRVNAEFDRVSRAFQTTASRQAGQEHIDTWAIIAILEEKRETVMAESSAGYFIRDWQELKDQVRQMLAADARYQAIQTARVARRSSRMRPADPAHLLTD
jgi:hypothetical protein